jgi:hypothetical protein
MRRSTSNNKNKNKNRKRPPHPLYIEYGAVASRTRRQKRAISSKWDLQTPIIIEIASWVRLR